MLWEDSFEIPLPPKTKNFTLEAFLNIFKSLRHRVLQTSESTLKDKLCYGKMFLKSPFPQTQNFPKFYFRSYFKYF
jgi:hypothetical protein